MAEEHAHAGARQATSLLADLNEVCDQAVIKVLAAQVRVARRRLDLLHSMRLSVHHSVIIGHGHSVLVVLVGSS